MILQWIVIHKVFEKAVQMVFSLLNTSSSLKHTFTSFLLKLFYNSFMYPAEFDFFHSSMTISLQKANNQIVTVVVNCPSWNVMVHYSNCKWLLQGLLYSVYKERW